MMAYFDASEAGGFLGVAGYLFRKKNVRPFEKKWRAMLLKYGLEYFHMTDCNAKRGQFCELGERCDEAARMAITAIKEFATQGFSAVVRPSDFHEVMRDKGFMTNPFSLCAHALAVQCAAWAEKNDPTARISYVFEAGDQYQADANMIFQSIADNPERRVKFRYENHAFLPKKSSMPTQAADMLVWHVCKQWDREQRQIQRLRGDFSELVESTPTTKYVFTRALLREVIDITLRRAPPVVTDPGRMVGLSLRKTNENAKSINREIASLVRENYAAFAYPRSTD